MEVSRIRELLEARQLSPTQFADLIGVGRPVISHILSGRNEPSLKVVRSIIEAFPDISLAWIMTGTGSMLTASAPTTPPDTTILPTAPASQPLSVASVATTVPFVASALPVAPLPPAVSLPATPALQVAAAAAPVAVSALVTPIQQLPQPSKFRPLVKATPQPALPTPEPVPAPTLPLPTPSPAVAAAPAPPSPGLPVTPVLASISEPSLSANLYVPPGATELPAAPIELPVPPPAPAYSPSSESLVSVPAAASASASPAALAPAPQPNPAAAFSFLGEAGKTIRRIVLFYNDGSFSDYRPEGQ